MLEPSKKHKLPQCVHVSPSLQRYLERVHNAPRRQSTRSGVSRPGRNITGGRLLILAALIKPPKKKKYRRNLLLRPSRTGWSACARAAALPAALGLFTKRCHNIVSQPGEGRERGRGGRPWSAGREEGRSSPPRTTLVHPKRRETVPLTSVERRGRARCPFSCTGRRKRLRREQP